MSLDPYKVLGVDKKADSAAIKAAYRKLARKYHPDVNPGDKEAEDKFKELSEAYDILSDPSKKSEYDNLGQEAFYERGFGGTGYQRPDFNQSFSFEDIFGDIFGAKSQRPASGSYSFEQQFGSARSQARRGEDYNLNLSISLREAAFGTEVKLELGIPKNCPQCHGQGILSSGGGVKKCPQCAGRGKTNQIENLKAKVPAGIKNGQKIRLKGKGSPGENGGPDGDLLVEVSIKEDPVFTQNNKNLSSELSVDLYTLLLGGEVEVPTLSSRAQLKIPSGTQNGTKMRLKGQGLPSIKSADKAGDLYVTIKAILPTKLNAEAKKIISSLSETAPIGEK